MGQGFHICCLREQRHQFIRVFLVEPSISTLCSMVAGSPPSPPNSTLELLANLGTSFLALMSQPFRDDVRHQPIAGPAEQAQKPNSVHWVFWYQYGCLEGSKTGEGTESNLWSLTCSTDVKQDSLGKLVMEHLKCAILMWDSSLSRHSFMNLKIFWRWGATHLRIAAAVSLRGNSPRESPILTFGVTRQVRWYLTSQARWATCDVPAGRCDDLVRLKKDNHWFLKIPTWLGAGNSNIF